MADSGLERLIDNGVLNVEMSRRLVLGLPIMAYFTSATSAQTQTSGQMDVLYGGWLNSRDFADQKEQIILNRTELGRQLGKAVAEKLHVVKKKGERLFGIIYDRGSNDENIENVTRRHSEITVPLELGEATVVAQSDYETAFNISFTKGDDLKKIKLDFAEVYRVLGESLGKSLVIEQRGENLYALVATRRGDRASSVRVAKGYADKLEKHARRKISASITAESLHEVIFDESMFLNVERETKAAKPYQPPPKAPITKTPEKPEPKVVAPIPKPKVATPIGLTYSPLGALEQGIRSFEQELRSQGKIGIKETLTYAVYDHTSKRVIAASKDHSVPRQAASKIKALVALAYFHQVETGKITYKSANEKKLATRRLELMIQKSNNAATNWVMDQVGGYETVNRILKANYGHIFADGEIVENIPPGGRTYRNTMSAYDCIRFQVALDHDQLPNSKEIRRLMSLPKRNRLYSGANKVAVGTRVTSKSGSTNGNISDMGTLGAKGNDGKEYTYSMVVMFQRDHREPDYRGFMRTRGNYTREIANLTYVSIADNMYPLKQVAKK